MKILLNDLAKRLAIFCAPVPVLSLKNILGSVRIFSFGFY